MNNVVIMLKGIKKRIMDKSFSQRNILIVLSVWIIGLTIYQCGFVGFFPLAPLQFNTISLLADALKRIHISGTHITNILYILGFNLVAMLIGSRVLRWLRVEPDSITTRLAFSIPIGFGIYSIGVFWIGISGLLYKGVVYVFLGLLVILSLYEIKPFLKDWSERASSGVSKIDYIFLPIIGLFVFMPLFVSFSPVAHVDAMIYHMALPKIYLAHHGIVYVPSNMFSTWPANTEMLFLLGLLISGESLSQLFSYSISLVFLYAIFSFGKKFFSKTVGYLCAIIFLLIPWSVMNMSQPMVDTNLTLYATLGIFAFLIWLGEKKDGWLYLSAICCGFAGAIKLQGLFFVPAFFVGFFLIVKRDAIGGKRLLYCMLAMGVVLLPWYIRSWILSGNPVFPLLYNLFGAKNWNDYSNLCLVTYFSPFGARGIRNSQEFFTATRWLLFSHPYTPGLLNPIIYLIFLIPGLISFKDWNKTAKYLFFIALAHYMFSLLFITPHMRYLFPCFAILSIIVAYLITIIWARHALLKVVIALSLVSFILVGLFKTYRINERQFFTGLGVINPQEYLKNRYPTIYELCQWTNKNLPEGSKILSWSTRGYFLDKEYVWIDPLYQGILDFGKIKNASEFLIAIKKLYITHILYFPNEVWGHPSLSHKQFLKAWHQELVDGGKIKLLRQINDSGIYAVN